MTMENTPKWSESPIHEKIKDAGLDSGANSHCVSPSGYEPLKIMHSEEGLIKLAQKYCKREYEDAEQYRIRFGMMVDFITEIFPS